MLNVAYRYERLPENRSFTGLFVITLMTPPIASEPYKADEAPFTISILSIFPTETLDKSKTPEVLPTSGTPSIRIMV
ncbi:hypothetical protein D3C84_838630 [compost metagenome]